MLRNLIELPALSAEHGRRHHTALREVGEIVLLADIDGNFRAAVDDARKVTRCAKVAGCEVVAVEHFFARESRVAPHRCALHGRLLLSAEVRLLLSAEVGLLRPVEGRHLRGVERRRLLLSAEVRLLLSAEVRLLLSTKVRLLGLSCKISVHLKIAPKNFFLATLWESLEFLCAHLYANHLRFSLEVCAFNQRLILILLLPRMQY